MLRNKGMQSFYPTTVAKIESGERAVRIEEAAGLADLFDVSLDRLLGRDVIPGRDLAYTLQSVAQTAQRGMQLAASLSTELRERAEELAAFDEFDGRAAIGDECDAAAAALQQAREALAKLWTSSTLRDALLLETTSRLVSDQTAEAASGEA
jgi:transcriptional regulator with XRE-family HTH domain